MTSKIYVGDQLSIFGILRFDQNSNLYFLEQPIAVLKDSAMETIDKLKKSLFQTQVYRAIEVVSWFGVAALFTYGVFKLGKLIKINRQKLELDNQKEVLKEIDYKNRLDNCPPFVRAPVGKQDKVSIDSYKCNRCDKPREIINLECMHCYLCFECFKKKQDKFICNLCGARVDKIVRIYVCDH